jgi:hypothetical protein
MKSFKKICYYTVGILLIYTVSLDLNIPKDHGANQVQLEEANYQIRKIKVEPGDTLLSIIESIHENHVPYKTNQLIRDFKQLNPQADPYLLQENTFYYFPYYN